MVFEQSRPKWTFIFIGICVILFFIDNFLYSLNDFAFAPVFAFQRPWTFVTSIFLHADFDHILYNMIGLFFFGAYLESRIDRKLFLIVFFSAGILGNISYMAIGPTSTLPAVGASGSVSGLMGALTILYPTLIIYYGFAPMPILFASIIWLLTNLLGIISPVESNIGYEAHLAGLAIGVIVGLYLRLQSKRKKQIYYAYYE